MSKIGDKIKGRNRTLIVYGTRMGATSENSHEIAKILRAKYNLAVDVLNLKKDHFQDLSKYASIIVGSGIKWGKWVKEPLQFLDNNFKNKKVAVFVSSSMAGDPKTYAEAYSKFIEEVLKKHPQVKTVATAAFGGRIRLLGLTITDNRDIEKVMDWANEVGKKFTEKRALL